ncbi:MAG: hypothetical protein H7A45_07590 [Verrucomicrobiales bacterium]|nr:hypothetical protein [Verrucomicrobiales bacterium]
MSLNASGYEVIIASPPEYEDLVAEIYCNGLFIAQLNREKGGEAIELEIADDTVDQSMVCRKVALTDFLDIVEVARQRLTGERP